MSKQKRLTNTQFVKQMMEFSQYGALAQIFILDAIQKQAKKVAEIPFSELKQAFGENHLINPVAWQGVAKDLLKQLEERPL